MWFRKRNRIADLEARLEVAQRPREGYADTPAAPVSHRDPGLANELHIRTVQLGHARRALAAANQRAAGWEQHALAAFATRTDALAAAEQAKATLDAVREITSRLAAHAVGFQDVLDATDAGPWGKTISADLVDLQTALGDPQPATEPEARLPWVDLLGVLEEPADPCAHGCRDAADVHTRLSQELDAGEVGS